MPYHALISVVLVSVWIESVRDLVGEFKNAWFNFLSSASHLTKIVANAMADASNVKTKVHRSDATNMFDKQNGFLSQLTWNSYCGVIEHLVFTQNVDFFLYENFFDFNWNMLWNFYWTQANGCIWIVRVWRSSCPPTLIFERVTLMKNRNFQKF